MVDIARSPSVIRKKKIRRIIYGAVALVAIIVITVGVSRLKPAAPSVDRATVWVDTVKRGQMLRQVRGSGTLVPEDIRWISATTAGRVERIVLRAGAVVEPTTVILELSSPDVEQAHREAQRTRTGRRISRAPCSRRNPTSRPSKPTTARRRSISKPTCSSRRTAWCRRCW